MITADKIKQVFIEKFQRTGDMDAAFGKAVWMAYTEGLLEGLTTENPQNIVNKTADILKKGYGE